MSQHQNKKTRKWFFVCVDFSGKQKKRMRDSLNNKFSTKREARAAEVLFKNLDDKYKNNDKLTINELKWLGYEDSHFKNTQVTFADLQKEHRKEYIKTKKPRTIEKYDSFNNLHILPYFENFDITDLHQRNIINWKNEIEEKGLSNDHSNKIYQILCQILDYGMLLYDLDRNVAKIAKGFKIKEKQRKPSWWEIEEFEIFSSQFDTSDSASKSFENSLIFNTFFYTGLRAGELLALQWKHIDFNAGTLTVEQAISNKQIGEPKTESSNRTIIIPRKILSMLQRYKDYKQQFYNFNDNFFVFGGSTFLSKSTLDKRWNVALEKANVKRIKLHDLRHSHATLLFRHEYNILYISKRLGHKTIEQTTQTYIHLAKEISERENEKISML